MTGIKAAKAMMLSSIYSNLPIIDAAIIPPIQLAKSQLEHRQNSIKKRKSLFMHFHVLAR